MENKKTRKLNDAVREMAQIKMTTDEKKRMLENILNPSPLLMKQPIKSPYKISYFISSFYQKRSLYYLSIAGLFIIIGSGSVIASQKSLPGDLLYPLKVNVVEPIHSALIFSPEQKAEYESSLAARRLTEAESLADQSKLDLPKEQKINSLLESHTQALYKAIDESRKKDPAEANGDDTIVTNFEATMNAHAQVLDILNKQRGKNKKENQTISENARDNAHFLRASQEKEVGATPEQYTKKKEDVQASIDSANTDLNNTRSDESSIGKTVIDNTGKIIEEAKKSLKEADEDNRKGNSQNAHSKLLDSESSAKEAKIFLKAGLKFK